MGLPSGGDLPWLWKHSATWQEVRLRGLCAPKVGGALGLTSVVPIGGPKRRRPSRTPWPGRSLPGGRGAGNRRPLAKALPEATTRSIGPSVVKFELASTNIVLISSKFRAVLANFAECGRRSNVGWLRPTPRSAHLPSELFARVG